MTRHGGVTDSWGSLHPLPQTIPKNLTPEQGVALLGISCDTPLNTWTRDSKWVNEISRDPIGERLDYIFFNASFEFKCLGSEVALQEKVPGVGSGPNVPWVNVSDHYGVHSVFSVKKVDPTAPRIVPPSLPSSSPDSKDDSSMDLFEHVLSILQQHLARVQSKSIQMMYIATPLLLLATLGLMIGSVWVNFTPRWTLLLMTMGVGILTIGWVGCFSYGFLYGGETISAFTNVIQEVQLTLENSRGGSREGGVFSLRHGPLTQSNLVQGMPAGGPIHLD